MDGIVQHLLCSPLITPSGSKYKYDIDTCETSSNHPSYRIRCLELFLKTNQRHSSKNIPIPILLFWSNSTIFMTRSMLNPLNHIHYSHSPWACRTREKLAQLQQRRFVQIILECYWNSVLNYFRLRSFPFYQMQVNRYDHWNRFINRMNREMFL